jgi:hypothetical protein
MKRLAAGPQALMTNECRVEPPGQAKRYQYEGDGPLLFEVAARFRAANVGLWQCLRLLRLEPRLKSPWLYRREKS